MELTKLGVQVPISPAVTIAVPSKDQGRFLGHCLASTFDQGLAVEVFVLDAGSTDESVHVIRQWQSKLQGWRSHPDTGQAAAINEGIRRGSAPYVAWLNSDDWLLPGGLAHLHRALEANPRAPAAYGLAWNADEETSARTPVLVEPFDARRLTHRCIVSQPATLIRRSAWEAVGGLDESLQLALDYDLWWRLYLRFGELVFVKEFIAVNRDHAATKTNREKLRHFRESRALLRRHAGRVPWKWWASEARHRLLAAIAGRGTGEG